MLEQSVTMRSADSLSAPCAGQIAVALFALLLVASFFSDTVARGEEVLAQSVIALPRYDPWIPDPELSELRPDVVTPHTPWARPYAGRSLKLVVIAPRWTQRATVELQQRFDFDASAVMTLFSHTWGDKNTPHYAWLKYGTEELTTERALAALRAVRRPDVIVIGWMSCPIIPTEVEQAILDAAAAGSGLVIFNPKKLSAKLDALIKQCRSADKGAVSAVVDGIPTGHLPPLKRQDPRSLIGQGVRFYHGEGGGRVVVVDYSPLPPVGPYRHVNCYLSPPGADEDKNVRDIHYDYYCSLAGRCILWAAKAMPEVRLTGWEKLPSRIETKDGEGGLGALMVAPAGICPKGAVAELAIRDSDSTVEHRESITVSPDGRIELAVGQLKSGGHYADVILRDAGGRTLDWGSRYFESTSGAEITSITTEKKSYKLDQPLPIRITLAGDLSEVKLTAEVCDTYGRVVWSVTVGPKPEISFRADVSDALTSQCEVRATLSKAGVVLARRTRKILVRQPPPEPDRYIYGAWASANPSFVRRQAAKILAAQGIRTGILGGDMDEWASLNVQPAPYMTRYYPDNADGKGLMIRKPCLTDPAFLKKEEAKLRKNAEKYMHYSPPVYSLGDDQGMMLTKQDGCISATCLKAFRTYLARQYGSVEALNASWGTSYSSFDQAMPLSLEDALDKKQYPRWADHRMYMDELFVKIHRDAKSIIRTVDPEARVGFEGPLSDNSWYGYAWKELMETVDLMVPYPNAWKFDIVRSFAKSGLRFGGWYGGYGMYRNPDDTRFYPWFLLFSGCNSYWFFSHYGWSGGGHPAEGLAPDLRVLPCLRETTTQVRRIQAGIDRLVLGAERWTDAVAVYHSRPSVHASTIMPPVPLRDFNTDPTWSHYIARPDMKWARNIEANLRLLDDMGLSYVFVDRRDIAAGALKKGKFRLLVMPLVQALSEAEAKAVKEFVKAGGTVLADVRPGWFDEHIKPLEKGRLNEVFGVKRKGSVIEPLQEEMVTLAGPKQKNGPRVPMPVDTTVSTQDGKAATVTGAGVPVFISNLYGKGRACLMNMSVQHYLTLRAAGRGEGIRNVLASWLTEANITPDVNAQAVGDHKARVRIFKYRDGQALLVGLLRPHKRLLDEPEAFVDRSARPFTINFGRRGHIYDVINRKYHGRADRLELEVPVATAFLFAVLPYRVTGVTAEAGQTGRAVKIVPAVQVSEGKPGRHVIRLQVTDARGRKRPEYEQTVIVTNGRGSYTFKLALNDPDGEWTIDLEDVATGTRGKASIQIQVPLQAKHQV